MFTNQTIKFDENVSLQVYIWEPKKEPVGVIQIAHGMAEHLGRYDAFGEYFSNLGYLVIGADHYAHGLSCQNPEEIGVIKEYDFMDAILKSIKLIHTEFIEPLTYKNRILFAHSMGSMTAQRYIELYPNDFTKVVICGTDCYSIKYLFAQLLTSGKGKRGKIVYSEFVHNMGVGSFNKKFMKEHPKYGWLSNDMSIIEKYDNDKLCGRMFPANYYHSLAKLLRVSFKSKELEKINKDLSIMIIAGKDDPVGGFGNGPIKLSERYLKLGLNTRTIIYDKARHELLNEVPEIREIVLKDLKTFMEN